jgi:hypothetical protein
MINGNKKAFENQLKVAFDSGYDNAASSFSLMAKGNFSIQDVQYSLHNFNGQITPELNLVREGPNLLVTTEVFGDATGKSYLFLSQHDFDLLTQGINSGDNKKFDLKEEFIKELDNILSAAVITKLSNELKVKMYGDVPILAGRVEGSISQAIHRDFNLQAEQVYICSTYFISGSHAKVSPLFIWIMDAKILNAMEAKSSYHQK